MQIQAITQFYFIHVPQFTNINVFNLYASLYVLFLFLFVFLFLYVFVTLWYNRTASGKNMTW